MPSTISLMLRNFLNAINHIPHAEERPRVRLEARTTSMQPIFFTRSEGRDPCPRWAPTFAGVTQREAGSDG